MFSLTMTIIACKMSFAGSNSQEVAEEGERSLKRIDTTSKTSAASRSKNENHLAGCDRDSRL
jgi:hypothetical protein